MSNTLKFNITVFFLFSIMAFIINPVCVKASNINSFELARNNSIKSMANEEVVDCDSTALGCVEDENSTAWLAQKILNYIKILGPTLAILLGSLDFIKAIIASDEENMKKTEIRFIRRIIAAVLLFFIPLFVEILLKLCGIIGSTGGLS